METLRLDVPTVHCRSCKLTIEEALDDLDGVDSSDVSLDDRRVAVTFDPGTTDTSAIKAAIEEAGYPVE